MQQQVLAVPGRRGLAVLDAEAGDQFGRRSGGHHGRGQQQKACATLTKPALCAVVLRGAEMIERLRGLPRAILHSPKNLAISIAMTAGLAKVSTSSICLGVRSGSDRGVALNVGKLSAGYQWVAATRADLLGAVRRSDIGSLQRARNS